jgi:hypothetical protein
MLNRLAVPLGGRVRGNSAAVPAYLPPPVQTPSGATNGIIKEVATLKSQYLQPLPQAVPPGPNPRTAQRSWVHGPTMGGGFFVSIPAPPLFYLRQMNEIPVPNAQVAGPGLPASMDPSKVGRRMVRRSRIGGRTATAAPFVTPTWPIYGTG